MSNNEVNATETAILDQIQASETTRQGEEEGKEENAADLTASEVLAKESERQAELNAEADKLLARMEKQIVKIEGEVSKVYLTVAGESIHFVSLKMQAGHGFNAASDIVRLTFLTRCGVDLNIDKAQRAYVAWNLFCDNASMDEKARDKAARSVTWETWYHVMSSLVQGKQNGKDSVSYAYLPHVQAETLELISGAIKERWRKDDCLDKAREIRAKSAQLVKEESEAKASEERKVKEAAEALAKEAKDAQEKADLAQREKAEEAKKAEQAAQDAQKKAEQFESEVKEDESAENDPAVIAEREAIQAESLAAQKKAQEAKEAEEKARQEKDKADKARAAQEKIAKDAAEALKTHEKTADKAGATLDKIQEQKKTSEERKSGASKTRETDKGENLFTKAREMAPADLAGMLFALLSASKLPSSTFAALVEVLNKDGMKLFKEDAKARKAIAALITAYDE